MPFYPIAVGVVEHSVGNPSPLSESLLRFNRIPEMGAPRIELTLDGRMADTDTGSAVFVTVTMLSTPKYDLIGGWIGWPR